MARQHDKFAVDIDGMLVVCTDNHISGDYKLVKQIKLNSFLQLPISITPDGPVVKADLTGEPINVLAALMSIYPERSRILEAPDDVIRQLPYQDEEEDGI